ncbi:hypothetical protein J3459_007745 [Metarhizium acridum]|uniref:uncharacterized protein n=1 Tax=Metarhizium acridum TaxID=92637 RepID=UPI001C6C72BB|nr:hypothetical protein J3458_019072 [Metarhizium acridum]KAG8426858.1 hypothetical protein J3459_007745 [Metarhizium acridum]
MMNCLRKAPAAQGCRDKYQSIRKVLLPAKLVLPNQLLSGIDGTFFHLPVITTHCSDEGKPPAPENLETKDDLVEYCHWNNLNTNNEDLALLNELYPDPDTHPELLWQNSLNSTPWNRIGAAVSDMAYTCPSPIERLPHAKCRCSNLEASLRCSILSFGGGELGGHPPGV